MAILHVEYLSHEYTNTLIIVIRVLSQFQVMYYNNLYNIHLNIDYYKNLLDVCRDSLKIRYLLICYLSMSHSLGTLCMCFDIEEIQRRQDDNSKLCIFAISNPLFLNTVTIDTICNNFFG